ncbi:hypothetical protein [Dyadobacter aurulentus]|uniref:hypothetical protein n=1 Tax=Dyadobacter sp. UC 10 TaxID=2605428 RepID=UPI0011F33339|nr:hypothetical protein [Dyadobacter sp. UC 10]KAA0990490.1 hypothetical protein FXO21_10140 [Dyadobacter sp. UC 10]
MKRFLIFFLLLRSVTVFSQNQAVTFVNTIPANYDPTTLLPGFMEVSPQISMPPGHVFVQPPTKQTYSWAQTMQKGSTHYNRNNLMNEGSIASFKANYPGRDYNGVPTIPAIFGLPCNGEELWVDGYNKKCWPNGPFTDAQARAKAHETWNAGNATNLWIGETMENFPFMPADKPMWNSFYDELAKLYEAKKGQDQKPFYLCHNYYSASPYNLNHTGTSRAQWEAMYSQEPSQWSLKSLYHAGGSLSRTNTVMEAIYYGPFDLNPGSTLNTLFLMEIWKKLGKNTGMFLFNQNEWAPESFTVGTPYAEGTLFRSDKPLHSPSFQILMGFLAHEYGNIFVDWGTILKQPESKKPVSFYQPINQSMDYWRPAPGGPASFPFYYLLGVGLPAQDFYIPLGGSGDYTYFGNLLWMQTGGQVAGGSPVYCSYRLDGGSWVERKANGSDIISAYFDKRGLARCRISGNKMMIYYFNVFADNLKHAIEIKHPSNPSKTYTGTVAGSGIHAVVVDL